MSLKNLNTMHVWFCSRSGINSRISLLYMLQIVWLLKCEDLHVSGNIVFKKKKKNLCGSNPHVKPQQRQTQFIRLLCCSFQAWLWTVSRSSQAVCWRNEILIVSVIHFTFTVTFFCVWSKSFFLKGFPEDSVAAQKFPFPHLITNRSHLGEMSELYTSETLLRRKKGTSDLISAENENGNSHVISFGCFVTLGVLIWISLFW